MEGFGLVEVLVHLNTAPWEASGQAHLLTHEALLWDGEVFDLVQRSEARVTIVIISPSLFAVVEWSNLERQGSEKIQLVEVLVHLNTVAQNCHIFSSMEKRSRSQLLGKKMVKLTSRLMRPCFGLKSSDSYNARRHGSTFVPVPQTVLLWKSLCST